MRFLFNKKYNKSRLVTVLVWLLMLSIVFATVRIAFANTLISEKSVQSFTKVYGKITDRFGKTIYDGKVSNPYVFANLIDCGGMNNNVLSTVYKSELIPGKVNFITGHRTMEKEPRILKTTLLSEESQQHILSLFGENSGCCFAFNYKTGEVYTALSLPSADTSKSEFSYLNRCFNTVYTPGSTMKIVTSIVAASQGVKLDKLKYTCTGAQKTPDEKEVTCPYNHGYQDFSDAIGNSCNCFFADIIMNLDIEKTIETLKELGFDVNSEEATFGTIDRLSKKNSSVPITNAASFTNVWGLIGQGDGLTNAVDLAKIAAAVANDGGTPLPYITENITNPNKKNKVIYSAETKMQTLMSEKTAKTVKKFWTEGYDEHYGEKKGLSKRISYAKTGTAEVESNNTLNRSLLGIIEESSTAFYIMLEDFDTGEKSPIDIANALADVLPKTNNG